MNEMKRLLTTNEAAEILRVPRARLWSMIRQGLLNDAVIRFNRQIRLDPDKLANFCNKGGTKSTTTRGDS